MNRQVSPFKSLMQGLYYPAILGTGIVLLLLRFTMHPSIGAALSDLAIYFGFLFALFFSASFLINQGVPDKQYRSAAFFLDMAEIVLVFLAYYALGLYNTSDITSPHLSSVYWICAGVIGIQNAWNCFAGLGDRHLWTLSASVVSVLACAALWGYHYSAVNIAVLVMLYVSLGLYFRLAFS